MPYLYLIVSVFCNASAGILGTFYNRRIPKGKDASALYTLLNLLTVSVCWLLLFAFDGSFDVGVLPYSLLFAACYTVCNLSLIRALSCGPVSLTTLLSGLSTIVTAVWGCIFWQDPFDVWVVSGLLAAIVASVLCLYSGKSEKTISWKWLGYALLSMFANAGCSIVQRTQQMQFSYRYGNAMMAFATLFSVLACLVVYVKSDREGNAELAKKQFAFPVAAGACNVVLNLFVILLAATSLSAALIYPTIGIGALAVTMLFSVFAFREKLKWWQWLGIAFGALATLLLSI